MVLLRNCRQWKATSGTLHRSSAYNLGKTKLGENICIYETVQLNRQLFRVYPNDRKDIVVEKDTPSGAWAEIFSRVQHFKSFREAGNDINDYDPASYPGM